MAPGGQRQAKFEASVSSDGRHWTKVGNLRPAAAIGLASARLDIFQEVGRANRVLTRRYPVSLALGGEVEVTLTPRVGKAILSAAALEPLVTRGQKESCAAVAPESTLVRSASILTAKTLATPKIIPLFTSAAQ